MELDTQEAPNSLSIESSSSLESLSSEEVDDSQSRSNNVIHHPVRSMHDSSVALSNDQYTGLVSRRMPLSASVKSAFSNYVRSGCRGEPDGRTAVMNDSRGRESDAAFTPSPVDPVHRASK